MPSSSSGYSDIDSSTYRSDEQSVNADDIFSIDQSVEADSIPSTDPALWKIETELNYLQNYWTKHGN